MNLCTKYQNLPISFSLISFQSWGKCENSLYSKGCRKFLFTGIMSGKAVKGSSTYCKDMLKTTAPAFEVVYAFFHFLILYYFYLTEKQSDFRFYIIQAGLSSEERWCGRALFDWQWLSRTRLGLGESQLERSKIQRASGSRGVSAEPWCLVVSRLFLACWPAPYVMQ